MQLWKEAVDFVRTHSRDSEGLSRRLGHNNKRTMLMVGAG